jgi:hypothetical protein
MQIGMATNFKANRHFLFLVLHQFVCAHSNNITNYFATNGQGKSYGRMARKMDERVNFFVNVTSMYDL